MSLIRLDRLLANAGAGSRSDVKKLIRAERVMVNGERAMRPEQKADPSTDVVTLDGKRIGIAGYSYYMLNKPAGILSATRDPREKTVLDLLPEEKRKGLFPVGRLDRDTRGLLLLTDDGQLAHRLLSPRHHVDKVYRVECRLPVTADTAEKFAEGMDIGDEKRTLPAVLTDIQDSACTVTLREGRYHQVKRMFLAAGNEVTALRRLAMGGLRLDGSLPEGAVRPLTEEEAELLERTAFPSGRSGRDPKWTDTTAQLSGECDVEE